MAFLPAGELEDSFVEDYMSDIPSDNKCEKFADYLTDNYVTTELKFPPHLWAEGPSDYKRTNNGPESFHAHFNEQFYFGHPGIYTFLDVLQKVQTTNYIKIRNMSFHASASKAGKERNKITCELYAKYTDGEITRKEYVRTLGYRYRARTNV